MNIQKISLEEQKQSKTGSDAKPMPVSMDKQTKMTVGVVFLLLILAGVGTGFLLSRDKSSVSSSTPVVNGGAGKTYGSADTKAFPDSAIGTVEKEGISGEGTHKLIRDGGPSQTACLVSSVLDLDEFAGKKVKVWGNTMGAKQCPWLMDIGRIELQ